VVLERLDDFLVAELEHTVALLHHGDLAAEGGEHGRVLHADHARADDHHRARHLVQVDDAVGVDDRLFVEGHAGRPGRAGAGGDDDVVRGDLAGTAAEVVDLDAVRADEVAHALDDRDPVAGELAAHHVVLPADHMGDPRGQVGDGDVVLDPVRLAVDLALPRPGQVENRLAQRLGRDRARVDAHPAHHLGALYQGHAPVQLRGRDGRPLPAGPGADYKQVVVIHAFSLTAHGWKQKRRNVTFTIVFPRPRSEKSGAGETEAGDLASNGCLEKRGAWMITPIRSVRRLARPAGAAAVALAVASGLAAGCGTVTASSGAGTASGGASGGAAGSPAPASASAVPTVTGTVPAGEVACVDWPSGAPTGSLPSSFVPVSVERCVNGAQDVPGQGLWVTATLERADSGLAGLVSALRQSPGRHLPGTVCPALATIPPEIVLTSATGQELMPRLPVTGCGITQSQVLLALAALRWHTVSVRLVSPVSGAAASSVPASPATVVSGSGSPHTLQTLGAAS
jgi:hypothetical protein